LGLRGINITPIHVDLSRASTLAEDLKVAMSALESDVIWIAPFVAIVPVHRAGKQSDHRFLLAEKMGSDRPF